ncbi:DNA/RNA non-specific endonuclease [Paraburkholderia sp. HD33-4]|uniref:DNA/RNA non-specific endonuclease n=1 Tax=Paraburkholderia sp. HD33-4 TaxID=2883242 RepID=UPI001F42F253|nr:DNA/RNA non-specific endonuclease [Paraburkholderia sp. HD33-4]
MTDYAELNRILPRLSNAHAADAFSDEIAPLLVELWADDYVRRVATCELLETSVGQFSYLFDMSTERLVAAWGISQGKSTVPRKEIATRMRGHPLANGGTYHRGHAIPHTLGGSTDINLVPQLGKINSGPFQALERLAVSHAGALYFTYWLYGPGNSQVPVGVEQGLLMPGATACTFRLATFGN